VSEDRLLVGLYTDYKIGDEVILDGDPNFLFTVVGLIIGGSPNNEVITHALCKSVSHGVDNEYRIELYRLRFIK
jgi:hypothetical protein